MAFGCCLTGGDVRSDSTRPLWEPVNKRTERIVHGVVTVISTMRGENGSDRQ
jgi:hypothetical protein